MCSEEQGKIPGDRTEAIFFTSFKVILKHIKVGEPLLQMIIYIKT